LAATPTGQRRQHTAALEDTLALVTADFAFRDADAGRQQPTQRIDSVPVNGSLLLNGVAVVAGQVISAADDVQPSSLGLRQR
jgi:hypothetical protein